MNSGRETVVYQARKIITMDRNRPTATHVAVRDGRILAVGDAACADPWGGGQVDDRYGDAILAPGFVEGHSHLLAGAMWAYFYAGFQDRIDPDGRLWPGLKDIDAVIGGLKQALADTPADQPVVAWGFDPIFLETERLNRTHLDAVSDKSPGSSAAFQFSPDDREFGGSGARRIQPRHQY